MTEMPSGLRAKDMVSQALEQATTLPAVAYADPAFHGFEQQCIFARSWQLVGRADQLCEAGDHVVAEVAGKPILVVRDSDGVLRGFFNVCRHRAGPLALGNGNARQLRCHYHGWTYTLEGQLRSAHEME
ncbi:MAG: aromatic ring-hydroxylating oxygenase subunit alpha, partial [Rhodanobacteraceae bacterium]